MSGSHKEGADEFPKTEDLISLNKAAKLSGFSQAHIRLMINRGKIWGLKIGRNWVTTEQAVKEYMARDRRPGPKSSSSKT